MPYEDVYARFKNLYEANLNPLAQKRDSTIQGLNNNKNDLTNQYADNINSLKTKQEGVKNQYANLYRGLDQQNVQAQDKNYSDRNQVDVGVNQNLNRVQEIMAKNGWLGGGENLQAQLNSNSDRMNGFGNADKTMGTTLNTVLQNRNQYQGDEVNANNEINNQISSSEREKTTKLQAIMDAINSANANFGADAQALKANTDAQAMAEIAQQEQAYQKSYASSNPTTSTSTQGSQADLESIQEQMKNETDAGTGDEFLTNNKEAITRAYGADTYNALYQQYLDYRIVPAATGQVRQNQWEIRQGLA
jgi:hypothetical protein